MRKQLYNKKGRNELKNQLEVEDFLRLTISFYRYTKISNPIKLREQLYLNLSSLNILGRIYIAEEGINAQISVPEMNEQDFIKYLSSIPLLKNIMLKRAIEEGASFYKLQVKVKKEIVAYDINSNQYDINDVGEHLSPSEFNKAIEDPNSVIVDIRNYYESEVGRFENAVIPDVDRSKELLPKIKKILKGKEKNKILLYCTGGIRCEKASSFLLKNNFEDVNQLEGGIINYAKEVKEKKIESKFKGKNFVFDNRMGERVTSDILSNCHQCSNKSDQHTNCANDLCHILFIQCNKCNEKLGGCCCRECKKYIDYSDEEKSVEKNEFLKWNEKRLENKIKPKLYEIIN